MNRPSHPQVPARQPVEEELLLRALHLMPTGFALTDLEGRYLKVNPAFCRLVGRHEEEVLGHTVQEFTHPHDASRQEQLMGALAEGRRETFQMEKRYVRSDGSEVWAFTHGALLRDGENRPHCVACQVQDISDRVASERALAQSLDRFSSLLASLDQGVLEVDSDGAVLYGNEAASRILGVDYDLIGTRSIWSPEWEAVDADLNPFPMERQPLAQVLRAERPVRGSRLGLCRPGGDVVWILVNAEPLFNHDGRLHGAVATLLDETEMLKQEKALFQAQKLESLGLLAGGIAHDFNNLLGAMLMNLGLARTMVETETNLARHLEVAEGLAEKSADLTRQLLAYAGKSKPRTEPLSMGELVAEMGRLLKASLPKSIHLKLDVEPEVPGVQGDRTQLQQVVLNLLTNAADAMGGHPGEVTLRVRRAAAAEEGLPAEVEDLGASLVEVSVSDQGCGMDEATLARIFDPFFTTKAKGRGLGLAALQGIVKAHGGLVTVATRPGQGTTFHLWFPALEGAAPASARDQVAAYRGEGLVLVVDDEDAVRDVAAELIRTLGFSVVAAKDGQEALELFQARVAEFRLVLLDLAMPRMGGVDVFEALRALRPDLPILMSTGFAPQALDSRLLESGRAELLSKPYRIQDLVAKVRGILEG